MAKKPFKNEEILAINETISRLQSELDLYKGIRKKMILHDMNSVNPYNQKKIFSLRDLAEKYNVSFSTVQKLSKN